MLSCVCVCPYFTRFYICLDLEKTQGFVVGCMILRNKKIKACLFFFCVNGVTVLLLAGFTLRHSKVKVMSDSA